MRKDESILIGVILALPVLAITIIVPVVTAKSDADALEYVRPAVEVTLSNPAGQIDLIPTDHLRLLGTTGKYVLLYDLLRWRPIIAPVAHISTVMIVERAIMEAL